MGELSIRPLEPERELDEFLAVFNQGRVRVLARDQWLEFEARSAGHGLHQRLVGRSAGAVVTVGTVDDDPFTSGGVMVWIATGPEHRRQGHGRAMLDAVERVLAERRPAQARAGIRDDDPESRA
jgi:ribosomal protein S18 acetylase RimI-like enzyme